MYFPQRMFPSWDSFLILRSSRESAAVVSAAKEEILGLDPEVPLSDVRTMGQLLAELTRGRRFLLTLISSFAVLALVLAMAGIFGTMSHNVAQRTREIGVRVAFGAHRRRILLMVLREGLLLDAIGIGAGLGALFFFAAILRSQLYGIGPVNLLYAGVAVALLAAVTIVAAALPALRASRIDPMQALRTE